MLDTCFLTLIHINQQEQSHVGVISVHNFHWFIFLFFICPFPPSVLLHREAAGS